MNKRQSQILDLLTQNKKLKVTELSEVLNVSQVTIRKDLSALEESGIIVREHGYAKLNESDDINNRLAYHYDIKQKIAEKAVESIEDGETVMIESGSCCALVALEIAKTKKDVTLITNSAFIADYIRKTGNVRIILLGGEYQEESQVMVGPITRKCAEGFFVDKLFVGTDGFTKETGFTGNDYMRSEAVKDMAKQASNVIIVTDSVKFQQKGVVSLLDTKKVSYVYTDSNIPEETEEYLIENNIKIIKA
ncbi:DeoR/GlpR family DNA-binding transcription regulator [Peptacetobacter sp. AB845]|uniref:DeoR/GlpR family DNA-binding transcription regulator n=1 Tax=Peptacetobacter sp. AB845 TaxID=3388429 RepID=UPI0039C941E5